MARRSLRARPGGGGDGRGLLVQSLTGACRPATGPGFHLPEETRRRLVAEIEAEAAVRREQTGSQVLGVSAVRGQHPLDRPKRSKKSPAPLFHAASKAVRRELYAFYAEFVAAYRQASEKLRAGDRTVRFLLGSFPPALPFVAG